VVTQLSAGSFAAIYLCVGLAAAVVVMNRPLAWGLGRAAGAGVALVFWPFVLPLAFQSAGLLSGGRGAGLEALGARVVAALRDLGPSQAEAVRVDALLRRLREADQRVAELDEALRSCPPLARPRLTQLRTQQAQEVERGTALLEDLAAQLLVLRFAPAGAREAAHAERLRVEELLASVEALTAAKLTVDASGRRSP
jgi:hypothetical protein